MRAVLWMTVCGVGVPALRRDGNEAWRGACPVYGCTAVALSVRLDDAGASLPVCSHKLYFVRLMSAVCACCTSCNANLYAISYETMISRRELCNGRL